MAVSARLRKTALVTHIGASVGWLGAVFSFLVLALVGVTSSDPGVVRGVYRIMEPVAWLTLVPLAFASLITGLVQSWVTPWGLLRHYWVLFKLGITVVCTGVLLLYMRTFEAMAQGAGGGIRCADRDSAQSVAAPPRDSRPAGPGCRDGVVSVQAEGRDAPRAAAACRGRHSHLRALNPPHRPSPKALMASHSPGRRTFAYARESRSADAHTAVRPTEPRWQHRSSPPSVLVDQLPAPF
ncbi:hypothetical protein ACFV7Q_17445 [Streptomyces sp. NPDC059851]|uniref:hypothetical protein n=1 Tax=Streptomyces sp. NPDC059851 TaxID=3346971 RepID=UPI0036609D94